MNKSSKTGKILTQFFRPNAWKLIATVLLYFSNYINFIGIIINYPIFYFYHNYKLDTFSEAILFVVHILYLYLMACVVIKLLR